MRCGSCVNRHCAWERGTLVLLSEVFLHVAGANACAEADLHRAAMSSGVK